MADQSAKFDPVAGVRQRYPDLAAWNDQTILQHLSDPNKFRLVFPEYSHLNDATIRHNVGQYSYSVRTQSPQTAAVLPSRAVSTSSQPIRSRFDRVNRGGAVPTSYPEAEHQQSVQPLPS